MPEKVAVVRHFAEVAAVGEIFDARRSFRQDSLIDPIPYEAALEAVVFFEQVGVVAESSAGVSHRVRVFAEDEGLHGPALGFRLFPFDRVFFDILRFRIHLAFDVGCALSGAVMKHSFVMDDAVRIDGPEEVVHFLVVRSAPGFVSERPDQDRRMIAVAEVHRSSAVEDAFSPFGFVGRKRVRARFHHAELPGSVRLEIRLVDSRRVRSNRRGRTRAGRLGSAKSALR